MKKKLHLQKHKKLVGVIIISTILMVPLVGFILPALLLADNNEPITPNLSGSDEDSLLWKFGKGLFGTGATMQPEKITLTDGGEEFIAVGTDGGFALIDMNGLIEMSYLTFGEVIDFEIIDDLDDDGLDDIIITVYDQDHANVIAVSADGEEIWTFTPKIKGIDSETYSKLEFITYSWDAEVIDDVKGDDSPEVAVASWFRVYVLDGEDGDVVWKDETTFTNDVWKLKLLEDDILLAGSEDGELVAFETKDGEIKWTYEVPTTTVPTSGMMGGVSEEEVPNSIDDIKITEDDNVLIACDDGYIRLISGSKGEELDDKLIYNTTVITSPVESQGGSLDSPYTSEERLFTKSGMKFYDLPDIDGDGNDDYLAYGCDMDYQANLEPLIESRIFTVDDDDIDKLVELNWSYSDFYTKSTPVFLKDNSDISLYVYSLSFDVSGSNYDAGIYRYDIEDIDWVTHSQVYRDGNIWEHSDGDSEEVDPTASYMLNLGDINSDGVDDLFCITKNGKYLCIDGSTENTIWVRSKQSGGTELVQIQDLNNDGVNDFLFKSEIAFEPNWNPYDDDWINDNEMRYPAFREDLTLELVAIDGLDGDIIWEFITPQTTLYEGIIDVVNVGDNTGDNIDDYAAWMIPSYLPDEIEDYIEDISGSSSLNMEREEYEDTVYRTLLHSYTRFIAIDGSTGISYWNTTLIDLPYDWWRQYNNAGTYESPSGLNNQESEYYNRINEEIDDSWIDDWYNIQWEDTWDDDSLTYASQIDVETGKVRGTEFDLWGTDGNNHTISTYNSSADLIMGTSSNSSSSPTEDNDEVFWQLTPELDTATYIINYTMSFNQSQNINSEIVDIVIDYNGYLSSKADLIDFYAYNFTSLSWNKVSSDILNATLSTTEIKYYLGHVDDYTDSGKSDLVKIRMVVKDTTSYTLNIDKLNINYVYIYGKNEIKAQNTGDYWQTLMNFSIPLDFNSEERLGIYNYSLSQFDRFSALKTQVKLLVNDTSNPNYYNFTYEIYNATSMKWIVCNWSDFQNYWNSRYNDLHGDYVNDYRNNYIDFDLDTSYRYDHMYLITRGTTDQENGLQFDYEDKTTLGSLLNGMDTLNIRINITHKTKPFNITIDNFGIGAFYWGLFSNRYDSYYLYDYGTDWESEGFVDWNVLNSMIADFEVINGTGDDSLDVLVAIGQNEETGHPCSRLRLIDIKNRQIYTRWSENHSNVPYGLVRITALDTSLLNEWIISGVFKVGSNYYYSHRKITNPHWLNSFSRFENYTESLTTIDFEWEMDITDQSSNNFFEIPGLITYDTNGNKGLILGKYSSGSPSITHIRIVELATRTTISLITTDNLIERIDHWGSYFDFTQDGGGYHLLIGYEDMNDDDYYDHVGYFEGSDWETREIAVFSGDGGDSEEETIFKEIFTDLEIDDDDSDDEEPLFVPFASVGDINDDGNIDGVIGLQVELTRWDRYCTGATLHYYDIAASTGSDAEELKDDTWELEASSCLFDWAESKTVFFDMIENVGDYNDDDNDDLLLSRNTYDKVTGFQEYYTSSAVSELVDPIEQVTLLRFNLDIDSTYLVDDINGDDEKELILASGEALFCINSEFRVEIENIEDDQVMQSNRFNIEWDTDADYDYFELFVNGSSHGPTDYMNASVSLGAGNHKVEVFMYDKSGLVIAIDTVYITVPYDPTMIILTVIIVAVIASLLVANNRIKKRKANMVLIERELDMEVDER